MKKILESDGMMYFLAKDGTTGYLVIIRNEDLILDFGNEMNRWPNPPCKEVSSALQENRGELKTIVMCSREQKMQDVHEQFGVDMSLDDLSASEVARIKELLETDQTLPDLRRERSWTDKKFRISLKRGQRIKEVQKLLKNFRYQDARDHCALFNLNYEEILEGFKDSDI